MTNTAVVFFGQVDQGWHQADDAVSGVSAGAVVAVILVILLCRFLASKLRSKFGVNFDRSMWVVLLGISALIASELARGFGGWLLYFVACYIGFGLIFAFIGLVEMEL